MTRFICIPDASLEDLDANDIALLVTLHRHADAGGTCFPSHETLAAKLKRSRRWVCVGLLRLEKLGRIKVTRRHRQDGGKMSSVYSLPTHVTNRNMACDENDVTHGQDLTNKKTHINNTPTQAGGEVVSIRIPQGWVPSGAVVQQAMLQFPDLTDQDLAEHTAKFTNRCKAKGYPYADFDAAWMDWLVRDRKEAKEKANAAGHRFPSARERRLQDERDRDAENLRKAHECLDRINRRRSSHGFG